MDIIKGLRVDSRLHHDGVCTGRVETGRAYPEDAARAEVIWPGGVVRWPLVSILVPSATPAGKPDGQ